jgi:hypothetical protein
MSRGACEMLMFVTSTPPKRTLYERLRALISGEAMLLPINDTPSQLPFQHPPLVSYAQDEDCFHHCFQEECSVTDRHGAANTTRSVSKVPDGRIFSFGVAPK